MTTGTRVKLALLLGSLSAFAPLTIDMYLPALPGMARSLHSNPGTIQLTLTVFVIGLAAGQLVVGPLSDAWGRRRPLLAGIALYVASSACCAVAPTAGWLIGGRVLQSFGAAAAIVLARAIVRDLFDGIAMTRFFSRLMLVKGVDPVLSPVIGSQLLAIASWRTVFVVLTAVGAVLFLAVLLALPESLPIQRRQSADLPARLRTFAILGRDTEYLRHVLAGALTFAAMFAYISGSSFVLQQAYGLSAAQFSVVFGTNGLGIVLFGQLNGLLVGRVATEHAMLVVSLSVAAAGSLGVLLATSLGAPLPLLLAGLFAMVSMVGVVLANTTSVALAAHGERAGAASSLQGLLQFLVAGLASSAMGLAGRGSPTGMGVAMFLCAGAALATYAGRRPRRAASLEVRPEPESLAAA
ncbi:MAG: transporter, family, multidrug resistance protein [Pseudonocardiales bacterium]|nr:transporter, family, multidrug resistance protein [Pseudonocardiales bacterium]